MNRPIPTSVRLLLFFGAWIGGVLLFTTSSLRDSPASFYMLAGITFSLVLGIYINRYRKTFTQVIHASVLRAGEQLKTRVLPFMSQATVWIYPYHKAIIVAATLIALYWMVQVANLLKPGSDLANQRLSVVYFIGGMLIAGLAAALTWRSISPTVPIKNALIPAYSNWILVALGIVILWALAEANGELFAFIALSSMSEVNQLSLLVAGIILLVWGLGGGGLPQWRWPQVNWLEVGVLSLILALALFLRMRQLGMAVRVFVDELNFGTYTIFFRKQDPIGLLRPEVRGFPTLYTYFQYLSAEQWGRDLVGLRLPSALFGTLTVAALYWLARSLFDQKTALIAAALLAVFPPHVHHSRLALNNIADPAMATLGFAFLAHAFRSNRRLDFALGGAFLGLTQYFYEGGRLLYPPLALAWIIFGLIFWRPRPSFKGILIALLAAVLIALPIYYVLYARDAPMTVRFEAEGLKDSDLLGEDKTESYLWHLKYSFLFYTTQPEWVLLYYGGQEGMILSYLLPACLLGLAFLLWRFYTPSVLILGWILATSIGNSFIKVNVITSRYVVVFPAIALLMAVGVRYTAVWLWQNRLSLVYQNVALAAVVGLMMAAQVDYYWGRHLTFYNQQIRQFTVYDGEDAMLRAAEFPVSTHVYILTRRSIDFGYARSIANFMRDDLNIKIRGTEEVNIELLEQILPGLPVAFFVEPTDETTATLLKDTFDTLEGPFWSPNRNLPRERQLVLYYLSAAP